MYKCEILKCIWKDKNKDVLYKLLKCEIELQFAPFIGLEIISDKIFTGKITRAVWSISDKIFTLQSEDEIANSECDVNFILSNLLAKGWKADN